MRILKHKSEIVEKEVGSNIRRAAAALIEMKPSKRAAEAIAGAARVVACSSGFDLKELNAAPV